MKRVDQNFIDKFKKDKGFEETIYSINESLKENEKLFSQKNPKERYCAIYILGVPRSGTTLINQYLASSLDVGYINNLIASFWKAPIHGIHLSKKLLGTDFVSDFKSNYGKTSNIKEPHEFGYFWSELLNFRELKQPSEETVKKQDITNLVETLVNMTNTFEKPLLFKSMFISWYASKVVELMPKSIFVYVKRNWMDNALSLLSIRKKFFNSDDMWASFKPLQYESLKTLTPLEQVVGQVYYLNKSFNNELKKIDDKNKIIISYEDFVKDPSSLRDEIINKSKALSGGIVKSSIKTPSNFNVLQKEKNSVLLENLKKAYEKFDNQK